MKTPGKKLIYVAGPVRAASPDLVERNIDKAAATAIQIWQSGNFALCPHYNNEYVNHLSPAAKEQKEMVSVEVLMQGCLKMVRRCDAIFMSDGWEKSQGALLEKQEAEKNALPVFTDLEELKLWANGTTR